MAGQRATPDETWRPFARRLAEHLAETGWTYAELSRQTGITTSAMRAWRHQTDPSAEIVEAIAGKLGLEPDDLWPGWRDGDRPGRTRTQQAGASERRFRSLEAAVREYGPEIERLRREVVSLRVELADAGVLDERPLTTSGIAKAGVRALQSAPQPPESKPGTSRPNRQTQQR